MRALGHARVYAVVFAGAALGGAARLLIDQAIPTHHWAWDIAGINVVGSLLLGGLMGWYSAHAAPWWLPGLAPGAMGGFTTFSSMAAPHPGAPFPAGTMLVLTLAVATAAAAVGWVGSDALAVRRGAHERSVDADRVEAEAEGYDPASEGGGP